MKPFRMFFGLAVGIILFLFVARIAIVAFAIAAVMSILYAVYRRLKDFISRDNYRNSYIPNGYNSRMSYRSMNEVEPLFVSNQSSRPTNQVRIITAI